MLSLSEVSLTQSSLDGRMDLSNHQKVAQTTVESLSAELYSDLTCSPKRASEIKDSVVPKGSPPTHHALDSPLKHEGHRINPATGRVPGPLGETLSTSPRYPLTLEETFYKRPYDSAPEILDLWTDQRDRVSQDSVNEKPVEQVSLVSWNGSVEFAPWWTQRQQEFETNLIRLHDGEQRTKRVLYEAARAGLIMERNAISNEVSEIMHKARRSYDNAIFTISLSEEEEIGRVHKEFTEVINELNSEWSIEKAQLKEKMIRQIHTRIQAFKSDCSANEDYPIEKLHPRHMHKFSSVDDESSEVSKPRRRKLGEDESKRISYGLPPMNPWKGQSGAGDPWEPSHMDWEKCPWTLGGRMPVGGTRTGRYSRREPKMDIMDWHYPGDRDTGLKEGGAQRWRREVKEDLDSISRLLPTGEYLRGDTKSSGRRNISDRARAMASGSNDRALNSPSFSSPRNLKRRRNIGPPNEEHGYGSPLGAKRRVIVEEGMAPLDAQKNGQRLERKRGRARVGIGSR